MTLGDVEVHLLEDGRGGLPREVLFADVPGALLHPLQVARPDLGRGTDMDPEGAVTTRLPTAFAP